MGHTVLGSSSRQAVVSEYMSLSQAAAEVSSSRIATNFEGVGKAIALTIAAGPTSAMSSLVDGPELLNLG